jgi:hypothetical protein
MSTSMMEIRRQRQLRTSDELLEQQKIFLQVFNMSFVSLMIFVH